MPTAAPMSAHRDRAADPEHEPPDEATVVRFLQGRPDFLAHHPSLYLTLTPPARVHGEAVADHMAAMVGAARRQNALLAHDVRDRRAGRCVAQLVGEAMVWLIGVDDPVAAIAGELALALDTDTASLCLETPHPGTRTLPAGMTARLLGGRDVVVRERPTECDLLHGDGAPLVAVDALVRLPLAQRGLGLLALGSRDPAAWTPAAEAPLALLGRGIAAALTRGNAAGIARR